MVHFGYDKKDAPPTTYRIAIDIESIVIHFCSDASGYVADIDCFALRWSLEKLKDRISRQQLICGSIRLEQTSMNEQWSRYKKLLFPLEDNNLKDAEDKSLDSDQMKILERKPQLIYKSSTRPSGDNVKYLEVNDACIIFIYPAWMFVKSFLQDLPAPDIMKRREVVNSLQVGDRWYRINRNENEKDEQPFEFVESRNSSEETFEPSKIAKTTAEYQLRIVLVSPRIILVDSSSSLTSGEERSLGKAVTLRLGHLDFLRKIDGEESITKSIFIHDLELFTGSADDAIQRGNQINSENSLLYPLCIGAGSSTYQRGDQRVSQCSKWLVADTISVRVAFTDMTLALDVLQKTLSDYQEGIDAPKLKEDINEGESKDNYLHKNESQDSVSIALGGFNLLVIDDSGRHFAAAQELVQLSLFGIKYNRWQGAIGEFYGKGIQNDELESITRLQLKGLEFVDFLQPEGSPFRVAAATKGTASDANQTGRWEGMNQTLFKDLMSWEKYSMVAVDWGYCISSLLLNRMKIANRPELQSNKSSNFIDVNRSTYVGLRDDVTFKTSEIVLQWNPSTAIALQRFLGRLKKQVVAKKFAPREGVDEKKSSVEEKRFVRVEFEIDALTLCLNKEHQHRRLLQITLSDTVFVFERDHLYRLNFHGFVGDINAWDCDGNQKGQIPIRDSNRLVLCVLRNSVTDDELNSCSTNESNQCNMENQKQERFLQFQYYCQPTQPTKINKTQVGSDILPHWVTKLVGKFITSQDIDDCLSLTVATVRFNYLTDRTGEIVDYLSNGLPGKGMGATSRAAKGFIQKRIRTRSFLMVSLNAPQLFLPRHRGEEEGIIMSLGDVNARSWFDEATVEECEAIQCKDLTIQNHFLTSKHVTTLTGDEKKEKVWWRMLSLSFTELGWRVHTPGRNSASVENPVDLHLHLRKPPSHKNLSLIVRCKLSYMDLVLSYVDYVLLRNVLNDNIMKQVDKRLWDHGGEAFPTEQSEAVNEMNEHKVKYAQDARFVRYGLLSKRTSLPNENENKSSTNPSLNDTLPDYKQSVSQSLIDFKFNLDGLNLVLHRDDPLDARSLSNMGNLNYDIASFEVDQVDLSLSTNANGAKSATIKFYQLALFDQGDVGRLAREAWHIDSCHHNSQKFRKKKRPSAFSVIAEGYDAFDTNDQNAVIDENGEIVREPQVTMTVDTRPSADVDFGELVDHCENTTVTMACIRMNCMNINPLIRPLTDIAEFLACKWSGEKKIEFDDSKETTEQTLNAELHPKSKNNSQKPMRSIQGFQFKIVAHYPRVFLLADESDPSTRALVLRGLAIVTTSIIKEMIGSYGDKIHTSIEGQFHSLESYINPQPRKVLEKDEFYVGSVSKDTDTLGVALIEPVSADFNFHQIKRKNFPLSREMYVNMESVSTTLSFEDIRLIESVFSRWKLASENALNEEETQDNELYKKDNEEVLFQFPHSHDQGSYDLEENPVPSMDNPIEIAPTSSTEAQNPGVYCGGYLPCSRNGGNQLNNEENLSSIAAGEEYSVMFKSHTLGLVLRKAGNAVVVDNILGEEPLKSVKIGDEIISIARKSVQKMSLQAVVSGLTTSPRPLTITFRRAHESHENISKDRKNSIEETLQEEEEGNDNFDDLKKSHSSSILSNHVLDPSEECVKDIIPDSPQIRYLHPVTVRIQCGHQHGLSIERSPYGNAAIVTSVDQSTFQTVLIDDEPFVPQVGALIIAINNEKIDYQHVKKTLNMTPTVDNQNSFQITFVEVTSDDWGPIDKFDIIISRIKLSIIDDIAGRDMPLLRGTLQDIAIRIERGLGLECNGIKVNPPSILMYNPPSHGDETESTVISDLSEVIVKLYANAETRVDYYNARIASWEPLLEPSHFNGELEYQQGQQDRPGALSLAVSDHRVIVGSEDVQQSLVCINITDAAADVLISAFYEWKQWRERLRCNERLGKIEMFRSMPNELESSDFEKLSENPNVITERNYEKISNEYGANSLKLRHPDINAMDMKKEAVQNAAQAALIFAKRRAVESQGADGAKPFMLRNKSGMNLAFVSQTQRNLVEEEGGNESLSACFDLQRFLFSSITKVDDGGEACFSMDTIEADELTSETGATLNKGGNKIRTYDGQFPLLSVFLQAPSENIKVEILQDLSVVKIGKKLRRLKVKNETDHQTDVGYVYVVWSVELEHNRRIITISSAVTLSSPMCSIPIEIGIKSCDQNPKNKNRCEEIISVGISTPNKSCYLPLWVDVCFMRADVFIRPVSNFHKYQWSSQSILQFKCVDTNGSSTWRWVVSCPQSNIFCAPKDDGFFPAWLSFDFHEGNSNAIGKSKKPTQIDDDEYCYQMICVRMFSSLSIRNILPEGVEWEVSNELTSESGKKDMLLDGSILRKKQKQRLDDSFVENEDVENFLIKSGDRKEILTCDISSMKVKVRFRCSSQHVWTDWVSINSNLIDFDEEEAKNTAQECDQGK